MPGASLLNLVPTTRPGTAAPRILASPTKSQTDGESGEGSPCPAGGRRVGEGPSRAGRSAAPQLSSPLSSRAKDIYSPWCRRCLLRVARAPVPYCDGLSSSQRAARLTRSRTFPAAPLPACPSCCGQSKARRGCPLWRKRAARGASATSQRAREGLPPPAMQRRGSPSAGGAGDGRPARPFCLLSPRGHRPSPQLRCTPSDQKITPKKPDDQPTTQKPTTEPKQTEPSPPAESEISKVDESANAMKIKFICNLLKQSPPGEFKNVFEDLRFLVCDDALMKHEAAQVCASHSRKNFTAGNIKGDNVLVTRHNDMGGNRFFDPQIKLSFTFDHLNRRADKILLYCNIRKDKAELWRETLNVTLEDYMKRHFLSGACRVYRKTIRNRPFLVVCMESHQYKRFWNILWKSEWIIAVTPPISEIRGNYNVQLHYFKTANLHWTASKTAEGSIYLIHRDQFALDFEKFMEAEDNKFQMGMLKNLHDLSDETWRQLRRRLPVTRTSISWDMLMMT
ncbi:F-actin-capping protein subunit alpha-3 [Liasis olivaceus]